ncbi:MAG TPA: acyl-CoA dehydrogenase family protein, partial [Solirubrobacteraceae bacterium]|nr:acyl-CoA dehydrogenase family protein [Solirubrobacteraceae bacterium]
LLGERAGAERVRELAEAQRFDDALWRELCELGWPGIALSEEHGGQGLGTIELAILAEELGRSIAAVPFLPSVMASALIEQAGSPAQCERWLAPLARGEITGALVGGDESGAELVIGAPEAAVIVIVHEDQTARLLAADECDIAPFSAIDPTRSAARVGAPANAGEELAGDVAAGLGRALVAASAELVGVADRALEMTVAYVKERRQFGVPVGSFQAVAHRCAQMLLDTEKARSSTSFAAWAADADPERLPEVAAMAKAAASDAGREVTASAIQAHGGIGFTWEAGVHWLYKRAQLDAALLGGASRQRARIASLLGDRAVQLGAPRG